jgi:hypothetical protein
MSERELQRIEVLSKVLERRLTVVSAATTRQIQHLLKAFRVEGAPALRRSGYIEMRQSLTRL